MTEASVSILKSYNRVAFKPVARNFGFAYISAHLMSQNMVVFHPPHFHFLTLELKICICGSEVFSRNHAADEVKMLPAVNALLSSFDFTGPLHIQLCDRSNGLVSYRHLTRWNTLDYALLILAPWSVLST
nr:hypothetical transcript [Hymenolepis microstoma]